MKRIYTYLGKVELQETKFNVHPFARSSSVYVPKNSEIQIKIEITLKSKNYIMSTTNRIFRTQTEFVYQQLVSYGRISGAHVSEKTNAFPGWDPARQMSGKLLKVIQNRHS